jgi:hypothetical protein
MSPLNRDGQSCSAAGDVPRTGLSERRILGSLPRLLALELVGEGRQQQHDLVGGATQRSLAILQVSAPDTMADSPRTGL